MIFHIFPSSLGKSVSRCPNVVIGERPNVPQIPTQGPNYIMTRVW